MPCPRTGIHELPLALRPPTGQPAQPGVKEGKAPAAAKGQEAGLRPLVCLEFVCHSEAATFVLNLCFQLATHRDGDRDQVRRFNFLCFSQRCREAFTERRHFRNQTLEGHRDSVRDGGRTMRRHDRESKAVCRPDDGSDLDHCERNGSKMRR